MISNEPKWNSPNWFDMSVVKYKLVPKWMEGIIDNLLVGVRSPPLRTRELLRTAIIQTKTQKFPHQISGHCP